MELQVGVLALPFDEAMEAYYGAVDRKDTELAGALSDLLNKTTYSDQSDTPDEMTISGTIPEDEPGFYETDDSETEKPICLDCDPELELRVFRAINLGKKIIRRLSKEFDLGLAPKAPLEDDEQENSRQTSITRGHLTLILSE